ncbi:hypothetical protein PRIPAC_72312, partial [Pristionchus pacificus]|uniref:Uncharacterized protein n=1 Tax=Pristionchus pacificus TaxID=54126 RepID=A0A2A6CZX4_PRIPA
MSFRVLEGADDDGDTHFFISTSPVISIEFYLGSQTRLIFAFILTEEFWKNCFRRHAVWSQRNVDMKNEYPHHVPNSFRFVRFLGERPHIAKAALAYPIRYARGMAIVARMP